MVRLFSTVLRREPDGRHVLVTPVEKLEIDVETTAFRAVEMQTRAKRSQSSDRAKLDSGDALIVSPDHPLTIVETESGPSPRVLVRHGLEAELSKSIYYELAEIALDEGGDPPGVWSGGAFFPLRIRTPNEPVRHPVRRAGEGAACASITGDLPGERAKAPVPAAVLVGVTDRPEPGVILTVRREHMRTHAGQVAFPGGRIDPGETAVAAALREAWEELGLDPASAKL